MPRSEGFIFYTTEYVSWTRGLSCRGSLKYTIWRNEGWLGVNKPKLSFFYLKNTVVPWVGGAYKR